MVFSCLITKRLISKKYITGSDARGNRSKTSINSSTPNKTTKWRDVSCVAEENTGVPNNLWTNGMKPYIKHNQLLMSNQAAASRRSPVLQLYQGLTSVPKHYHVIHQMHPCPRPYGFSRCLGLPCDALSLELHFSASVVPWHHLASYISIGPRAGVNLSPIEQRKGESSGPSKSLIIR